MQTTPEKDKNCTNLPGLLWLILYCNALAISGSFQLFSLLFLWDFRSALSCFSIICSCLLFFCAAIFLAACKHSSLASPLTLQDCFVLAIFCNERGAVLIIRWCGLVYWWQQSKGPNKLNISGGTLV